MSQTISADVLSKGYWAYVASATAEGLGEILEGHDASAIPPRVYADAAGFFRGALDAAKGAASQNPAASIANYVIATDAAKARTDNDRDRLGTSMEQFAGLLNRLSNGEGLRSEEREIANGLVRFFRDLQEQAEAENYSRVVRFDPTKNTLRMW